MTSTLGRRCLHIWWTSLFENLVRGVKPPCAAPLKHTPAAARKGLFFAKPERQVTRTHDFRFGVNLRPTDRSSKRTALPLGPEALRRSRERRLMPVEQKLPTEHCVTVACSMPALPLIAAEQRTSRQVRFVPNPEVSHTYSITSSARPSRALGTARPSVFAVFRLMAT